MPNTRRKPLMASTEETRTMEEGRVAANSSLLTKPLLVSAKNDQPQHHLTAGSSSSPTAENEEALSWHTPVWRELNREAFAAYSPQEERHRWWAPAQRIRKEQVEMARQALLSGRRRARDDPSTNPHATGYGGGGEGPPPSGEQSRRNMKTLLFGSFICLVVVFLSYRFPAMVFGIAVVSGLWVNSKYGQLPLPHGLMPHAPTVNETFCNNAHYH